MKWLTLIPLDLDEANAFVVQHHRHHGNVRGYKFALGAVFNGEIVGVVIVGRPTSFRRQDGLTLEVTRMCDDNIKRTVKDRRGNEHVLGVCSFLYGAARRATFALGYKRLGTYILKSESGVSLKAAGWRLLGETPGKSWSTPSRPRVDKHPLQPRLSYEA